MCEALRSKPGAPSFALQLLKSSLQKRQRCRAFKLCFIRRFFFLNIAIQINLLGCTASNFIFCFIFANDCCFLLYSFPVTPWHGTNLRSNFLFIFLQLMLYLSGRDESGAPGQRVTLPARSRQCAWRNEPEAITAQPGRCTSATYSHRFQISSLRGPVPIALRHRTAPSRSKSSRY